MSVKPPGPLPVRPSSTSVVPPEIVELLTQGRLHEAWLKGAEINHLGLQMYNRVAQVLAAASWLSSTAVDPDIQARAHAILQAIGKIESRWVEHTEPQALQKGAVPQTLEAMNRLFVTLLKFDGFYHPIDLPGVDSTIATQRPNARSNLADYHQREWALITKLIASLFPGGLAGKAVLDLGPADGFFTMECARVGGSVLAYEKNLTMAVRTAVFSALGGVSDQVTVRLQSVDQIDPIALSSGPDACDLVLALGVIYHFDDLVDGLMRLTGLRVPIVFEFVSTDAQNEDDYDPAAHRDSDLVSLRWLLDWLEDQGFEAAVAPEWGQYIDSLPGDHLHCEMVLAVPRT